MWWLLWLGRYEALESGTLDAWLEQSLGATQEILSSDQSLDSSDMGGPTPFPQQMEEIMDLCTR